jgi:hypothetical protein
MWGRSFVLLISALVGVGCGSEIGDAHRPPDLENKAYTAGDNQVGAVIGANTPTEPVKEAAPKSVVYSSSELAKILDLSALPAPEGTKFGPKSSAAVTAYAPGTVSEVSAFYQKNLLAQGWALVPDPNGQKTDEYALFQFRKDGYLASLAFSKFDSWDGKGHRTYVSMQFHGNLDARDLPSPAANRVLSAGQTVTSYLTDNTVAESLSWALKTLTALGWQEFTQFGEPSKETDVHRTLTVRKQGYALTIYVGNHPVEKKTYFQYTINALSHELPTPPGADKVHFDDAMWQLSCELQGDWKSAAEYYQKAMPALGYKPLSGEAPQTTYWNLSFGTTAGDLINVQVLSKDKQVTQVRIEGTPVAVLEAIKEKRTHQSKK